MHPSDDAYVNFMEDTGAEYVGRMMMWIYFRKKAADGAFDLFSDIDSKIAHLDRIGKMLAVIGGANLVIGILNSFNPSHVGWLNLVCATVLMYALGRIHGKKEALELDRQLRE
jgi:Na+/H+ antiporter NhaD/arsenite permease-like protein